MRRKEVCHVTSGRLSRTAGQVLGLITLSSLTFADSPVTSTSFYVAYLDVPIVVKAESSGIVELEIAEYLHSRSIPLELKAAVMNALSWGPDEKRNADFYTYYLALAYGVPAEQLTMEMLDPHDLFCLGYLSILDDYFYPSYGRMLLELAAIDLHRSLAVSMIVSLARAQEATMGQEDGGIWELIEEVINDQTLWQDLRPEALDIIVDYMILYR